MAQDDIQGQVVDAQGNPVSGAIVELTKSYQSSPLDEQVVRRTTTDANGNYIFEFHPDGDGTTQEWHVSCYNHDGTAYVNSFNNPGVTADLPSNAIPDSDLDHLWYGPTASQVDPLPDEIASLDASAVADPTLGGSINGNTSILYDGVDDYHSTGSAATVGSNSEFTFVAVAQTDTTNANQIIFNNGDGPSTDGYRFGFSDDGGFLFVSNGIDDINTGSYSTDPLVLVGTYDGSNFILDANGTERVNSSIATPNPSTTTFTLGAHSQLGNFFNGAIGAVGHESGFGDATRRDELTNSFADAFDIAI